MSSSNVALDPDRKIWGGRNLATEAGCVKEDGSPDVRKFYHLVENGHLGDAVTKVGRYHVSTPRRLQQAIFGDAA
jgi:hypothetical protein